MRAVRGVLLGRATFSLTGFSVLAVGGPARAKLYGLRDNLKVSQMTLQQLVAVEEIQQLVARGQEQNFLSLEEVAIAVEGLDRDPSAAEELYRHLEEMGIELLDETDAHQRIARLSEEADRPRATGLTTETGIDSLRLFLRDIGRIPLLTAAQEVSLAKRIELGDLGAKREIRAGAPRSGTGRRSAVCRSSWTG